MKYFIHFFVPVAVLFIFTPTIPDLITKKTQSNIINLNYHDGDSICYRPMERVNIKTLVPDNQIKNIYLLVHPTLVDDYWVQAALIKDSPGNWHITPYIGKDPESDNGLEFELVVVINASQSLIAGQKLSGVPKSTYQSTPITVVKKHCSN